MNYPLIRFYSDPENIKTFHKMVCTFFDVVNLSDQPNVVKEVTDIINTIEEKSSSRTTTFFTTALLVCTMVKLYLRDRTTDPGLVSSFFTHQSFSYKDIEEALQDEGEDE